MDAMLVLEESLRDGVIDSNALSEVVNATSMKRDHQSYWDNYCSMDPSAPECLIYDV